MSDLNGNLEASTLKLDITGILVEIENELGTRAFVC